MLKELFKSSPNTSVYESYKSYCKNPFPPLFFYHLNRTGGLAIYYSLSSAFLLLSKIKKAEDQSFPDIRFSDYSGDYHVGRWDSSIKDMSSDLMQTLQNSPISFYATHQPYGFHKYFDRNYHFMTILRDPFDRLLSIYLRKCMHEKKKPSNDEFKTLYIQCDGSRNGMVRSLAGNENKFNSDTERVRFVIDNLRKVFHTFTISKNIDTLISRYLSIYQLPNVIMDMPNKTPHEQHGLFERFRDEIYALNQEDLEIFKFVKDNPKIPELVQPKDVLNPYTVLICEQFDENSNSQVMSQIVKTDYLISTVQSMQKPSLGSVGRI